MQALNLPSKRTRGNPSWGHARIEHPSATITEFEFLLEKRGIPLQHAHESRVVKIWVEKNYRSRYVPEKLLKHFHLSLDGEEFS